MFERVVAKIQHKIEIAQREKAEKTAVNEARVTWKKAGLLLPDDLVKFTCELDQGDWDHRYRPQVRANYYPQDVEEAQLEFGFSPGEKDTSEMVYVQRNVSFKGFDIGLRVTSQGGKMRLGTGKRQIHSEDRAGKHIELEAEEALSKVKEFFADTPELITLMPEGERLDLPATMKALSDPKIDRSKPEELLHLVTKK